VANPHKLYESIGASFHENLDGAACLYDFSGDSNKPADTITLPDGPISVTAGNGYNFHFYLQEPLDD